MKFCGEIGFWVEDVEVAPDVYVPQIVEKHYVGEIQRDTRRFTQDQTQNQKFSVSNRISILADLFAQNNYMSIRYVIHNGQKIEATSVTLDYPRLTIEMGGVYNGENAPAASSGTVEPVDVD